MVMTMKLISVAIFWVHLFLAHCRDTSSESNILQQCGDWTPYKDEKCLKVVEAAGLQTQQDAAVVCHAFSERNDDLISLLTVKTAEEQEYLHRFIFVDHDIGQSVWLELKKNASTGLFEWSDGRELLFTNWSNHSGEQSECVEMTSDGFWQMVSCERKNTVVCEKRLPFTLERLETSFRHFVLEQEIKQKEWRQKQEDLEGTVEASQKKITLLEESNDVLKDANQAIEQEIKDLKANPVPVGFVYVQLPNQSPPTTLWPLTNWTEVSSDYGGLFFRVVGGGAAPFGQTQDANTSRLEEVGARRSDGVPSYSPIKVPTDGSWSDYIFTGEFKQNKNVTGILRYRLSKEEIRPRNQAVKLWKRT